MTATATERHTAPLARDRAGGSIAGVCAGVARWLGIDPLVLQVLVVALVLVDGEGLLLYGLGWLLLPAGPGQESELQLLLRRRVEPVVLVPLAMVLVGGAALGRFGGAHPGVVLLVLAGVGYALAVRRGRVAGPSWLGGPHPATVAGPPPATEPDAYGRSPGAAYVGVPAPPLPTGPPPAPAAGDAAPPPDPPPPPGPVVERRPSTVLGQVTLSAAVLVAGAVAAAQVAAGHRIQAAVVLAAALACVGAGLVVGAVLRRARWLVWPGTALALGALLALPLDAHARYGVGERHLTPTAGLAASYRFGLGELDLDLSRLPAGTTARTSVRLGVGQLVLTVPHDAAVHLTSRLGVGELDLPGTEPDTGSGRTRVVDLAPPAGAAPGSTLTIDARLDAGTLEVRRARA